MKYITDGSSDVCFYYIVFPHMMLIIFFCLCCFFYLTSVFPSITFAKIIHQVTSYQEPINAFSDDKLLDSKSDWKYPLRSQIMYFSSYDDSLEHPKVIWNEKKVLFRKLKEVHKSFQHLHLSSEQSRSILLFLCQNAIIWKLNSFYVQSLNFDIPI